MIRIDGMGLSKIPFRKLNIWLQNGRKITPVYKSTLAKNNIQDKAFETQCPVVVDQ